MEGTAAPALRKIEERKNTKKIVDLDQRQKLKGTIEIGLRWPLRIIYPLNLHLLNR